MSEFFRFPHTPHLAWLGPTSPRNDKILSPAEALQFLSEEVTVEEKLDGANLGISADENGRVRFQNRGQYLVVPYTGQFSRLNAWVGQHEYNLLPLLQPGLILFGEWMAARHSIGYSNLPDWFVAFDVHDGTAGRFLSVNKRNAIAEAAGLPVPPLLFQGKTTLSALTALVEVNDSRYGASFLEGIVVRCDDVCFNRARAKLVRSGFTQDMGDHWRRRTLEWNRLRSV